ncbi:MAG: hypothetical protein ABSB59_00925 [Streptosporangiaceae bacterium]
MTAGTARRAPSPGTARLASSPVLRLAWLYAASRRLPAAAGLLAACAACLRVALAYGHWDAYGALQLPLIAETGCAAVIAVTAGSPFGEPERATGRWLPFLRLGGAVLLTALAAGALIAAGLGVHLSGGFLAVLRNVAGLTGLGLLGAVLLGGPLAWTGPLAYLLVSVFALYTDWHPPTLSTPWLWPGRPPHDVGGALCAAVVFGAGLAAITSRGARDAAGGEPSG